MKHTKEPWKVLCWNDGTFGIYDKNDDSVGHFNEFENPEDADRIVACVNACAGMTTEGLETFNVNKEMRELAEERAEFRSQRDKLLEVKEKLYGWLDAANFKKNEYFARAEKAEAQRDELFAALNHYADEGKYFPRGIVLECQAKGIRLAEIYSDFGKTARAAIDEVAKIEANK